MPKSKRKRESVLPQTAIETEDFGPYMTSILTIVMATFAIFGVQSITLAVQSTGTQAVAECFAQSNESAYHRFMKCTDTKS
ncbi:MAG: hypothetical protein H0W89_06045 [Candidatus Levybacteria bacterium]|nr:hypothetical protein [Candidatus Levybacteria bacterium]